MTESITQFKYEYAFLSNFYPCKVKGLRYSHLLYPSVEHLYQAEKFRHLSEHVKIIKMDKAGEAKKWAHDCIQKKKYDCWSQEVWEKMKFNVMRYALQEKFSLPYLRSWLLNTSNAELVEGNTWHDLDWGCCICDKHEGKGKNMLGILLMELREKLRGTR